jgi:hypothetical protein
MRHLALLAVLFASCASGAQKTYLVRDLIGNARHGQRVRVFGYITLHFERLQIGHSEIDVSLFTRWGIWLEMTRPYDDQLRGWGLVEGTVDFGQKGFEGMYPFALRNVSIVRLYPAYAPDHRDVSTLFEMLLNSGKKDLDERDLETVRAMTGHDAGPTLEDWIGWFADEDNAWRQDRIDRKVTLPDDLPR